MTTQHYTPKEANRRYMGLMLGSSLGYVVALLGVTALLSKDDPITPLGLTMAFVPGLFVIGMLYAMWRFIKEVDEVARFYIMRALVMAAFVVMAVAGTWGLLEMILENIPRLPIFWAFPLFFFIFGIVQCLPGNRMSCRAE